MKRLYYSKSKAIIISFAIVLIAICVALSVFMLKTTKATKSNLELSAIGEGPNLQSEIYTIEEGYISRILPETTLRDLKNNLDEENIIVYKKDGKLLQDTEFVGTGMKLVYSQKEYKLAVIDDLNGDGKAGITDLTQMKLVSVGLRAKLVNEYAKAGDINNDGKVSITDLTKSNLATVNLIDIIAPVSFTPEAVSTKDTITILGETADSNSGVKEYWFEINNNGWVSNTDKLNNKYTFSGLNMETKYTIRMKVVDNAGNTKITKRVEVETLNEENANISIVASTQEWTNQSILVAINFNSNVAKEKKQVSIDNGNTWVDYTNPITVEKNITIKARVVNSRGEILEEQEKAITNIDKLPPQEFTITATTTSNSITVNAVAEDATATEEYGKSGIKEYEYTLVNGRWKDTYTTTEATYTFDSLTPGMEYTVKVKAIDNAGNERMAKNSNGDEESGENITLGTIDDLIELAGGITINAIPSTENWTNEDITVTVTYPEIEGFIKEISTDNGSNWKTYSGAEIIEGNTTIKVRMKNSSGQTSTPKDLEITNIDKLPPQEFEANITSTSNSITVTAETEDAQAEGGNASSGIAGYKFKINDEEWTDVIENGEYTFTNLTAGQTYTIKVKAIDNAGNEKMAKNSSGDEENGEDITTVTIDEIIETAGGITINATPSTENWTNEDITVTVVYPDIEGFTKEISTNNGYDWKTYTGEETIEGNTTVKARMKDSTNQTSTPEELTIDKIDKLPPQEFNARIETTADTITVKADTSDAEAEGGNATSGIAGYKFKIDDEEWTDVIENGEYTFTDLTEGQTYKIIVKAIDNAGNETIANNCKNEGLDVIPSIIPEYYGEEVTNYTEGGITWRIFHKDDENIYLIADDYIPYDQLPTTTSGHALTKGDTDYTAYWNETALNDYTGSAWIISNTNAKARKWLTWVDTYQTSTNENIKAVAYMMDTDKWSEKFANNDMAEYAIGGPTLELFCASYKETHKGSRPTVTNKDSNGYQISYYTGKDEGKNYNGIYSIEDTSKATGHWDASPSNYVGIGVGGTYIFSSDAEVPFNPVHSEYNMTKYGFRPVVCIKSGYDLVKNEDGTYSIEDKGKPTLTVEGNTDEWTRNKTLTITVADSESGIKSVTVNGSERALTNGVATYTAYSNGTYTIVVTDNAGNTTTEEIEITKVDNTAPTITFSKQSNSTELATQEIGVTVTEEGSGIKTCKYLWSENEYTPTDEDSYIESTYYAKVGDFKDSDTISTRGLAGNYYLHVYLEDNLGNKTTTRTEGTFKFRYEISNAEELIQFLNEDVRKREVDYFSGKTAYIVDDITFNRNEAMTIGVASFKGTLEGNGHTINGLNNNFEEVGSYGEFGGIFSNITETGKLLNLGVANATINSNGSPWGVGGIVGRNEGTIENCWFSGEINITDGRVFAMGGIVATNRGIVQNCYTAESTRLDGNGCAGEIGGIVGQNDKSIIGCYNLASITAGSNVTYAGGIAGANGQNGEIEIKNCYNRGDITISSENSYVGGIAGKLEGGILSNCYNTGVIRGTYYIGGIVGSTSSTSNGNSNIENVYNKGNVYVYSNKYDDINIGGIAGFAYANMNKCYNEGVIGNAEYSGGIIGYTRSLTSSSNTTISNCKYKQGTSTVALGYGVEGSGAGDVVGKAEVTTTMPTILSVVGTGTTYFKADTGINDGYPILSWQ